MSLGNRSVSLLAFVSFAAACGSNLASPSPGSNDGNTMSNNGYPPPDGNSPASDDGGTPPPSPSPYTLVVTAPTNGTTVSGPITVAGQAPDFLNVEVWDARGTMLARATLAGGSFSATIDSTQFPDGAVSWTVNAWDSTPGQPSNHSASVPLDLTLHNGNTPGGLDYMVGYGGSNTSNAAIAQAEAIFGRHMDLLSDGVTVDSFQYGPYASSNGRAMGKVLIFELLSFDWDGNKSLVDMAAAASGAYDGVYTQMAQAIASSGDPVVSVRPGHEMNGNWYPWSAVTGNTHNATPANYIATFHRVAQIIRQYNPNALIEWCTAIQPHTVQWSGSPYTPLDYWVGAYDPITNPGGADVISMDFYEGLSGTNFNADIRGGAFGLNWLVQFAQQNGVKVGLSEVATGLSNSPAAGSGCPCSNDGVFMQGLVDWLNGLPPGLLSFFVYSPWAPADDVLASGNTAIQQVWHDSWANTFFAGSWWKGPKVPSQL
ncbi:MAG: hypothetical protein JWN44_410 [Myxococcales bacterium]|nr:hypothetical protein [Myxococcales bacterium]